MADFPYKNKEYLMKKIDGRHEVLVPLSSELARCIENETELDAGNDTIRIIETPTNITSNTLTVTGSDFDKNIEMDIQAGTNISIDKTNPKSPIISAISGSNLKLVDTGFWYKWDAFYSSPRPTPRPPVGSIMNDLGIIGVNPPANLYNSHNSIVVPHFHVLKLQHQLMIRRSGGSHIPDEIKKVKLYNKVFTDGTTWVSNSIIGINENDFTWSIIPINSAIQSNSTGYARFFNNNFISDDFFAFVFEESLLNYDPFNKIFGWNVTDGSVPSSRMLDWELGIESEWEVTGPSDIDRSYDIGILVEWKLYKLN